MLALYRSGRQAEALEAYRDARRALADELGIEPGRALRELEQGSWGRTPSSTWSARRKRPRRRGEVGVFVGREAELEELHAGLDAAVAGRGGLFLLVGEPGIGKSRLADEVIAPRRVPAAPRVLVGRCWEAGGAPAYWPWVQSLRAYVERSDPRRCASQLAGGAADVAQIVPELRELFPDLPEPRPGDRGSALPALRLGGPRS